MFGILWRKRDLLTDVFGMSPLEAVGFWFRGNINITDGLSN
jgi:hypothetical protein